MEKSIGELLDDFVNTNIKLFFVIEKKHEAWQAGRKEEATELAIKEDQLNGHRSACRNAINTHFGSTSQEIKVGLVEKFQK